MHNKKITIVLAVAIFFALSCAPRRTTAMINGASPDHGKTRPPIFMEYQIGKITEPGAPCTVQISGKPLVNAQSFKIRVRLPQGVTLLSGSNEATGENVQAGNSLSTSFVIQADQASLYYLPLDGSFTNGGQVTSDTISIPFQVGDQVPQQKPGPIKNSGGEKIIEMPASH
jgi:hypothetical protein